MGSLREEQHAKLGDMQVLRPQMGANFDKEKQSKATTAKPRDL